MAKYVCDYAKTNEIARKLIVASGKVSDSLKQYEPAIEKTLSTWQAESKDNFINHINGKVHTNIDKIGENLYLLGEYTEDCVKSIYNLEDALSQLNI